MSRDRIDSEYGMTTRIYQEKEVIGTNDEISIL